MCICWYVTYVKYKMHGATIKVTKFRIYRKVGDLQTLQLVVKFTIIVVVTVRISVPWRMM